MSKIPENKQPLKKSSMEAVAPQVTALNRLGKETAYIDCPHCKERTTTRVQRTRSLATKLAMTAWCLFCGCCAAYCARHQYMDIDHFCTGCEKQVAHKVHGSDAVPTPPSGDGMKPSEHALLDEAYLMQPIRPEEAPSKQALPTLTHVANSQRPIRKPLSLQNNPATEEDKAEFEQPIHSVDSHLEHPEFTPSTRTTGDT